MPGRSTKFVLLATFCAFVRPQELRPAFPADLAFRSAGPTPEAQSQSDGRVSFISSPVSAHSPMTSTTFASLSLPLLQALTDRGERSTAPSLVPTRQSTVPAPADSAPTEPSPSMTLTTNVSASDVILRALTTPLVSLTPTVASVPRQPMQDAAATRSEPASSAAVRPQETARSPATMNTDVLQQVLRAVHRQAENVVSPVFGVLQRAESVYNLLRQQSRSQGVGAGATSERQSAMKGSGEGSQATGTGTAPDDQGSAGNPVDAASGVSPGVVLPQGVPVLSRSPQGAKVTVLNRNHKLIRDLVTGYSLDLNTKRVIYSHLDPSTSRPAPGAVSTFYVMNVDPTLRVLTLDPVTKDLTDVFRFLAHTDARELTSATTTGTETGPQAGEGLLSLLTSTHQESNDERQTENPSTSPAPMTDSSTTSQGPEPAANTSTAESDESPVNTTAVQPEEQEPDTTSPMPVQNRTSSLSEHPLWQALTQNTQHDFNVTSLEALLDSLLQAAGLSAASQQAGFGLVERDLTPDSATSAVPST